MSSDMRKKGFTLIELLVVTSIISLLSSVVLSSLSAARENARLAAGKQFDGSMYRAYAASSVGIWDFNEGSGAVASDLSGNRFNGTFTGTPTWTNGIQQSALKFDGGEYVVPTDISGRTDLVGGVNGKVLFTAWIRPTAYTAGVNSGFVAGLPGINYASIDLNRKLRFMVRGNGAFIYPTSNASIPLDKWTHVGFLLEGGVGYTIFIDGKEDKKVQDSGVMVIDIGSITTIGRWYQSSDPFVGDIDSVRVYYPSLN